MLFKLLVSLIIILVLVECYTVIYPKAPPLKVKATSTQAPTANASFSQSFGTRILVALKHICTYLALLYVFIAIVFIFFFNQMAFVPHPASYKLDDPYFTISTQEGEKIAVIHLANPNAQYTVLVSHGNAEDVGDLLPYLESLYNMNLSVVSYDYPGYGQSDGSPSEASTYRAHLAVYDYLTHDLNVDPAQLILLGRSLGGAVAIELATHKAVRALILESTFTSAMRVATKYPIFPFDRYPSLDRMSQFEKPILVIHGERDQTITIDHGKALYHAAKGPKMAYWVPKAGHNDVFYRAKTTYLDTLKGFIETL